MINKAMELSTKFIKMVNGLYPRQTIQEAVSQKHCYLCDTTTYEKHPICNGCKGDLPFNQSCCTGCALPLPVITRHDESSLTQKRLCGACLQRPTIYTQCFSAFSYTFPVNALISDFKYSQKRHLGKLLSDLAAGIIEEQFKTGQLSRPDKLVPVPLHADKLHARGFNQSEDICRDLSQRLKIGFDRNCIVRQLNNPAQASLSKKQRQKNLAQAFSVQKRLDGEIIALVDDVITTGATADMLSNLLLEAGAKEVYVWSLARTPLER
ncbi:ComF family protein [Alkalimarinus coralli]|uniref:ComF family protein n=1 Tax=Alkalimarinus coralli TaxID=2935863 RepID=UPI00202B6318|nr:ComF family protein [Alkalimarinus coralli]